MLPGMIFIFEGLPLLRRLLHEKPMLPSLGAGLLLLGVLGLLADLGSLADLGMVADLGLVADLDSLGSLGLPCSSWAFGVDTTDSVTATCGAAVLG